MALALERILQNELANFEPSNWGLYQKYFIKREVPVGDCIPDLICVGIKFLPGEINWPINWNGKHSFVLWLLKKFDKLKLGEIINYSFDTEKDVKQILSDLVSKDFVYETENKSYKLSKLIKSIDADVISFEVKINDWKEALCQAKKYLHFSDKAIVVIDQINSCDIDLVKHEFEKENIGLCLISKKTIQWIIKPIEKNLIVNYYHEFVIFNALLPRNQIRWELRYVENASFQALM